MRKKDLIPLRVTELFPASAGPAIIDNGYNASRREWGLPALQRAQYAEKRILEQLDAAGYTHVDLRANGTHRRFTRDVAYLLGKSHLPSRDEPWKDGPTQKP